MTYREYMALCREDYLKLVVASCDGFIAQAAKRAGVNRTQFYKLLHKAGLPTAMKSGLQPEPISLAASRKAQASVLSAGPHRDAATVFRDGLHQ